MQPAGLEPAPRWPAAAPWLVVGACALVAVASLALPVTLAFDPWAWLVWGRELVRFDLDTTGGPSWKPLPVAVAALVSLAGGAAPAVWLVVARTASLLALAGAFRVAERLAGRWAGALAALLLLLTPDTGSRFLRLVGEGHAATIAATCGLWAVDRHLAGARGQALLLLTGLALLRPEAWPFLALYGAWLWWNDRGRTGLVGGALLSVPVLWFGGDWWGSGDPLHGADAAQVASGGAGDRLVLALEQLRDVVPLPVWIAAVLGVVLARHRSIVRWLAAAAAAWSLVVIAMATLLAYAALSRFYLPAATLLCVLAGVGVVRALALAPSRRAAAAVAVVALLASLPWLAHRVEALDRLYSEARTRHRLDESLDAAIADAGGRDVVTGCGAVAIEHGGLAGPLLPGLAWKLDVPLHEVRRKLDGDAGVLLSRVDGRTPRRPDEDAAEVIVLGGSEEWLVLAVDCKPTTGT